MQADRWGPLGALLAALIYARVDPVIDTLRLLQLDFLVSDPVAIPLFVGFLAATLWSVHAYAESSGPLLPLVLAWTAAAVATAGLWLSRPALWAGLVVLAISAVWNRRAVAAGPGGTPGPRRPPRGSR